MNSKLQNGLCALLIGVFMYVLSFFESYKELSQNWLAVTFMFIVVFVIGYVYGNAWEKTEDDETKNNN